MIGFPKTHTEKVKLRAILRNIMEVLEKKYKRIAEAKKEEEESRSVVKSAQVKKLIKDLRARKVQCGRKTVSQSKIKRYINNSGHSNETQQN